MANTSRSPGSSNTTIRDAIVGLLRRREHVIVTECRRCGTSVETGTTDCPACDCDDIVEYTIQ